MAASTVELERTNHEVGYVSLLEVQIDGKTEWHVDYRDGGCCGRYWYGEYERALAEYRRRSRVNGSMA